jgi:hypothetical protein
MPVYKTSFRPAALQGSDQTVKPRPRGPLQQQHGPPPNQPYQPTLDRLTNHPPYTTHSGVVPAWGLPGSGCINTSGYGAGHNPASGLDGVVTVPLLPPPVLREGHPEPAIDGRGGLERAAGSVRLGTEGCRKAEEAAATVRERG